MLLYPISFEYLFMSKVCTFLHVFWLFHSHRSSALKKKKNIVELANRRALMKKAFQFGKSIKKICKNQNKNIKNEHQMLDFVYRTKCTWITR